MVSPGCTHCYAMRLAGRLVAMGSEKYQHTVRRSGGRPVWTGHVVVDKASLDLPLTWRRPRRIFVNSMSDLFHENVSVPVIEQIWSTMVTASWHTFQVLTKRPERMAELLVRGPIKPEPHIWLGTSIESAEFLDRLTMLRSIPNALRFVSFEPLLGPLGRVDLTGIHWAIVGGESGPDARPMLAEWVNEIRTSCASEGVPFFFKQWGGVQKHRRGRMLAGRTYDDFPAGTGAQS
jgi:protein gp37